MIVRLYANQLSRTSATLLKGVTRAAHEPDFAGMTGRLEDAEEQATCMLTMTFHEAATGSCIPMGRSAPRCMRRFSVRIERPPL